LKAQSFSKDIIDEIPFKLNDIKKYIDFRESMPQLGINIILLFIFGFNFSKDEYNDKMIDKLDLLKDIQFLPVIEYDE
jgi:hypothetical protein